MSQTNTEVHRTVFPRAVGKALDKLDEYDDAAVSRVELKITTKPERGEKNE